MSTLTITLIAGVFAFLSIYLSFDYWYERIWTKMLKTRDETHRIYEDLFYQKTPDAVLREQALISSGAALVPFFLFWPTLVVSVPVSLMVFWGAWHLPKIYLNVIVRPGRIQKFSIQMVDALTLMANGLKANLSIPQTLQIVVDEMPNPIKEEFRMVLSENNAGVAIDKAFEGLGRRINSEDVSMFVTSVNILSETGGNTAETFQSITKTIRERLKLQNKIQAMTAQGMTSAVIVGMLPWALAIGLYFVDPQTMGPLFTHPAGWAILLLVTILEVIGFFVIIKLVSIKV